MNLLAVTVFPPEQLSLKAPKRCQIPPHYLSTPANPGWPAGPFGKVLRLTVRLRAAISSSSNTPRPRARVREMACVRA